MSAPWEIYVGSSPVGLHLDGSGASTIDSEEMRYLRANLTCGECSIQHCYHHGTSYQERQKLSSRRNAPACMEFKP